MNQLRKNNLIDTFILFFSRLKGIKMVEIKSVQKDDMPLVSVIIPVYNVRRYLSKCIESVREQTYKNIEIIIVDDGSTDGSGEICEEYAKQDERVLILHKENGGLSSARNVALDIFHGEYVTFIDSDDYVKKTYVEKMVRLIKENEADISIVNFIRVYDGKTQKKIKKTSVKIYKNLDAMADMFYQKNVVVSAWAKLYHRNLFTKIRYPVGKLYEDLGTTYKLFFLSNKIAYSSEQLYYYSQRKDSIMQEKFSLRKLDRIELGYEILLWSETYCLDLVPAAETRFFIANMQVLREIPMKKEYKEEIELIKKNVEKYRKSVIYNKEAKKITRLIAFCSKIDIRCLKCFGQVYKKIYK